MEGSPCSSCTHGDPAIEADKTRVFQGTRGVTVDVSHAG